MRQHKTPGKLTGAAREERDTTGQKQQHFTTHDELCCFYKMVFENRFALGIQETKFESHHTKLIKQLGKFQIKAEAIHGNKSQGARQRALENFKNRDTRVLIATDIAARGIDVDELELVINFDLPNVPETYVHRIGRTGRAFSEGVAHTLYDPSERIYIESVEHHLPSNNEIEEFLMPKSIPVEETPPWEAKQIAKDIDFQRKKADPTYKGAFHQKKKKQKRKKK